MAGKSTDNPVAAKDFPTVSVVIPHLGGDEILQRCLRALTACTYPSVETILVDNGSQDGSSGRAAKAYPEIKQIRSETNLGYAGGCNLGLRMASGEYALLLNDDAEVTPEFLHPLVACLEADSRIGACQPKIRSILNRDQFDYAGAAGGYLDRFGYPFCRGRVFMTVEKDQGQYDDPVEIFWASGACCLLRMSTLAEIGLLDEDFFAHMEEIDLQWRMRIAGYRVMVVPSSIVYHEAGSTLGQETPGKVYLNHRNGLMMILKNHRLTSLATVLPVRLVLELVEALYRLARGEFRNMIAIFRALASVLGKLPAILKKRALLKGQVDRTSLVAGGLYSRSIVWDYFVAGRKTFSNLRRGTKRA